MMDSVLGFLVLISIAIYIRLGRKFHILNELIINLQEKNIVCACKNNNCIEQKD